MLHRATNHYTKILVISVIAVSFAACTGTESANSPDNATSSPATSVANSSSQTAPSTSVTVPGVQNVSEINFKPTSQNPPGFFDRVNNSGAATIEVQKATPLTASGWAVLTNEGKLPDSVLITYGDNNSLVAVAPVNIDRPDVVKVLKNPAYKNSGWTTTFNSSALPAGRVVLQAWAYNAARKEATQLGNTREVVVPE